MSVRPAAVPARGRAPVADEPRTGLALLVIVVGVLMAAVDTTIVVLALPEIERSLHVALSGVVWVIIGYLLVITLLATQVGRLGDMFGRVRMYETGFAVFVLGSLLCALSWNEPSIIVFRVVQGIGGALIMANSGAVIADLYPREQRGRAYGFTSVGWTIGAVLGVVLAPSRLVTVRFAPSLAFQAFLAKPHEPAKPRSADILIGLLEAIVDRQADALEEMRAELNRLSDRIFHVQLDPKGRRAGAKRREQESELREMVTTLGRLYDSLSMIRDSQLGIGRAVPYVTAVANWMPKPMTARLKVIARDVASLNEFITHLSDKVQFVLDATLGLINIAQNDLMKVLTIVSVIGIPPTVIVGIYGMNFVNMPELHWHFGYYYALSLLAVTAVVPLAWFRRKGWL